MITVVGEALVDLVVDGQGAVTSALGGAPFNTARTCGRLGADVAFAGSLSVDRFGALLFDQLVVDRVGTDLVVRCDAPTTLAVAELDQGGAASYRFYIDGTSAPAFDTLAGVAPGMLFVGGLGLVLQPMATAVEAIVAGAGNRDDVTIMVDVNARPAIISDRRHYAARVAHVLGIADVVKVSDEDLAYLEPGQPAIEAARRLLAAGPRAVLLTAGRSGVTALIEGGERTIDVEPVVVIDTIGAGDAFSGGFMAWWSSAGLGTGDLRSIEHVSAAVEAACTVAGVVCSRRGADPPWRKELADDWSPPPHAERGR